MNEEHEPCKGYRKIVATIGAVLIGLYVIKFGGDLNQWQMDTVGRILTVIGVYVGGQSAIDVGSKFATAQVQKAKIHNSKGEGFHS